MPSHAQNEEPRTIGRRRVVRSAAVLAWTVPAIQVATAVPAFAAVSGCCDLSISGSASWRTGDLNYIDIPVTITNGCNGPVSGLTVTIMVCGIKDLTYAGADFLPSGWTQAGHGNKTLDADGNGCYTLTYLTAADLAGNATVSPTLTIKTQAYKGGSRPAGSITAQVSTSGCSSSPVAIVLPQVG